MATYAASNNGLSVRAVDPDYIAQSGEVVFDHYPTDGDLGGAFSGYAAAYSAAQAPALYGAALLAGLQITSTGTPALNGTYVIDDVRTGKIAGIAAGIAAGKGLPGGGGTFNYPDATGAMHAFTAAAFLDFAKAVEDFVYAAIQTEAALIGQHSATWPSPAVTIP